MRLAIMQPYFLPYVSYFSLIDATDHFVVFDPVQFIRHGWINRNRILKPDLSEPQYFKIPLTKHSQNTPIKDITISENSDWRNRILRQVEHYKNKAPYFHQTKRILEHCFDLKTTSIVELNVHCLETVCAALGLPFNYSYYDEIRDRIEPAYQPGEWALHISTALNARSYVNLSGGRDMFDANRFNERGIELKFIQPETNDNEQMDRERIPGLSIINVLMFNSLDETRQRVSEYTLAPAWTGEASPTAS